MKTVKLLVEKGTNKAGSIVEYDDSSAEWLVMNGYALEVTTTPPKQTAATTSKTTDEAPAAPRRGRPRKAV